MDLAPHVGKKQAKKGSEVKQAAALQSQHKSVMKPKWASINTCDDMCWILPMTGALPVRD